MRSSPSTVRERNTVPSCPPLSVMVVSSGADFETVGGAGAVVAGAVSTCGLAWPAVRACLDRVVAADSDVTSASESAAQAIHLRSVPERFADVLIAVLLVSRDRPSWLLDALLVSHCGSSWVARCSVGLS